METSYTIDKAAYLLGVEVARLEDLIARNLIETEEVDGAERIPKREIARLYSWVTNNPNDTDPRAYAEADVPAAEDKPIRVETDLAHGVRVTDPDLLNIYGEMHRCRQRIENLSAKIKRLGTRIGRLQAIGAGENARFWERACAVYPELWGEDSAAIEERDGAVYIRRRDADEREQFKQRLQSLVTEGIRKGHLPPGFLGLGPETDGEEDEEP